MGCFSLIRRVSSSGWLGVVLLLPLVASAEQLSVRAERLSRGDIEAKAIRLSLDWPVGATHGELQLSAGRLRLMESGLQFDELSWRCNLQREADGWSCAGPIAAKGLASGNLQIAINADGVLGEFSHGQADVSVETSTVAAESLVIAIGDLPVDWLQSLLGMALPHARFTSGTLDARLAWAKDATDSGLVGTLSVADMGLDTEDGRWAAAAIQAKGTLRAALAETTDLSLALTLSGGEVLAGPAYILLPSTPIQLEVTAQQSAARSWSIPKFHWADGNVLVVDASANLDPDSANGFGSYSLTANSEQLDVGVDRYARSLLASLGLPDATASGRLALDLSASPGGEANTHLRFVDLDFASGDGRLKFGGLAGAARFASGTATQTSQFEWGSAELFGIPLGAAEVHLQSLESTLELAQPLQVSVFTGSLTLSHVRWSPRDQLSQVDVGLQLQGLDMAKLSAQFGWPAFSGSLSGQIPSAKYSQGRLDFAGGLQVDVFDGRVSIDALALERPFGIAPTLSANVVLRDLDLQPLTAAFGFGEITGRLDGDIANLRLLDWQPAAFDARFATVARKGVRRRISQRAVNDLSRVGGGLVGGLQSSALRVFDSFGYRRIGIGCRLANNVCTMSGIDAGGDKAASSAAAGYTVVEGSGLPRITVNGFAREVDWPVLVARLQAVSAGEALRIE